MIAPAQASEGTVARDPTPATETDLWHYGAYLDVSYILNFNFPENHLWRNRATAVRHNEFAPNMALAYVRKDVNESSRWGMELGVQGGYDSDASLFCKVSGRSAGPTPSGTSIARMSRILPRSGRADDDRRVVQQSHRL